MDLRDVALSASSSWLVDAAASTEVTLSTDVRFRPPWPYQDLLCLLFGGIQTEFESFVRSHFAPTFLGYPHDLSNTQFILGIEHEMGREDEARPW